MVLDYKHEQVWASMGKDLIWESNDVKILGISIDRDLKFEKNVLKLCSKANQKICSFQNGKNAFFQQKKDTFYRFL